MKKIVSILVFLCFLLPVRGQVIPTEKRVDWQQLVRDDTYKEPDREVSIMDFGGVADGKTDNSEALQKAMAFFANEAGTVFFPSGTYLFRHTLSLPDSIQIRGAGPDATVLKFDLEGQPESCIRIAGKAENTFVSISGGLVRGSRVLISDSAFLFSAGDWIELVEDNGSWNTVPIDWDRTSVGQIILLKKVSGDTLVFEFPLRISFQKLLHPRIRLVSPVKNVSVSCLKLVRIDQPDTGGGYNIFFDYAVHSRVTGVESDTSSGSHVYISRSAGIRIAGCYFHHAFVYDGVSTHGYGVTLAHHTGECLVENNIFAHLRHALMVKTGANGNVIAYNYSLDPFRSEQISDLSGDISLHGHYPFANLFEGNIVQNIIIDHYWGPSGPWNTFFRNRAELWGILMTKSDTTQTSYQNFVGNECTDNSLFHGQFVLTGNNHFVYCNNILGKIIPSGTDTLPDSSYYLSKKPTFWDADEPWPDVGLPNNLGTGIIPAKQRFENGGLLTVCPGSVTKVRKYFSQGAAWQIGPNPVRYDLNISAPVGEWAGSFVVRIFDLRGRLLLDKVSRRKSTVIQMGNNFYSGIYFLEISTGKGRVLKKIILEK